MCIQAEVLTWLDEAVEKHCAARNLDVQFDQSGRVP